jgi:cystinosin
MTGEDQSMSEEPLLPTSSPTSNSSVTQRKSQVATSSYSSSDSSDVSSPEVGPSRTTLITSLPSEPNQHGRSTLNNLLIRVQAIPLKSKILALLAVGTFLGSILPKNENLSNLFVRYLSSIIGYIYFLCWSVSFYPQVIMIYTRKSTTGLSADYSILNVMGFGCYTIYATSFYFSSGIRKEYEDRNNDGENSVQSNDVAFAVHALLLSSLQMWLILQYDAQFSWKHISTWTRYFLILSTALCVIYGGLILSGFGSLQWIDYLYMLSSIKLVITIIKYIPQVLMNYQRKSTVGWNVWNVLLDFTGGILSLMQLLIDALDMHDFSVITGNLVKFGLGLASILFDIVFIVQHYVLYPHCNEGVATQV